LVRAGTSVTILSAGRRPGRTVEEGVGVVRLPRLPGSGLEQEVRFGREVFAPLVAGRYDVVHSLGVPDAVASLAAARVHGGRRTVYTNLGNPDRAYYRSLANGDQARAGRRVDRQHLRIVQEVDVYGCLSHYAAGKLETDFGRRAALTPGGVDLKRFMPGAPRSAHPTLLYSGSLTEPRKGVATLLDALDLIADKEPSVRLWLSGPGDPSALLEQATARARERVDVLALGTPDLAQTYGSAWTTVLPSVHEAFGLSLLESLACGTPVVGANHAALPELVGPGVGALSCPGDPVSLAEACLRALEIASDPGAAERCRAAAEPYDWDGAAVPELLRLYNSARQT
jgi:phosphatidylinositol alpha-mannosyltransferase